MEAIQSILLLCDEFIVAVGLPTWIDEHIATTEELDYGVTELLSPFTGTHPAVMQERMGRKNWKFDRDSTHEKISLKDNVRRWIERVTGWRMGEYKNYILLR